MSVNVESVPRDQAEKLRQLMAGREERRPRLLGRPGQLLAEPEKAPRTRVLTVASGKGGVGKTNLVVNLGIALAQRGLRVGILDADLGLANIDIVLGMVPPYNLVHVLRGEKALTEIMVRGPEGVQVFAGGSGVYELANVAQWHLDRFIAGLRELDGEMDICLIDTGAGVGRQVMSFVDAAQEAVIITTPEPTAVTDAYGLVKMLSLHNQEATVRIVVNMVESQAEGKAVFERLRAVSHRFLGLDIEYLGSVERDGVVAKAVRDQRPFMISNPHSRAAQAIQRLADVLTARPPARPQGLGGIFQKMLRLSR
ncbi:MAG: MinD/ParA family protein [Bacillota bacterium]|nr:MinD/ParA family protein [Bacillota bacterium]